MKKILSITTAILLMFMLSATFSFAADDPPGVVRSGDTTNFLKDAPVGTVTIDTSKMNITNSPYEFATTNPIFEIGQEDRYKNYVIVNESNFDANSSHSYDGTFTLTFPGIATLQDGSMADVIVTYSDVLVETREYAVDSPIGVTTGRAIGPRRTSNGTNDAGNPTYAPVAFTLKANIRVVQNGEPVDGSILFATQDLDVLGATYPSSSTNDNFKESFKIVSGAVSDAYIPTDNFCDITGSGSSGSANGIKFTATKGDDNTYNTGFAVLGDANQGITLQWWGQGGEMGTTLFTANISHVIESTSGKGGTIKTTTTGAKNSGQTLEPSGQLTVPDGRDQVYTLVPETGFEIGKLTIDGEEIDPNDSSTWPEKVKITKNSDGSYDVTFEDNNVNRSIDVQWNPIVTATSGEGGSISDPGDSGVESGSSKTYTFTPELGYQIDKVVVDGKEVAPVRNDDGTWSYTLDDVTDPTKIEVSWKKSYTVVYADGAHGKSDGGNETGVVSGDKPKGGNNVTPDKGYHFTGKYEYQIIHDDGSIETGVTDDPTKIAVTGNIIFTPHYEANKYTVHYDANGGSGKMVDQFFKGSDAKALSKKNAFKKDGYRFMGFKVKDKDGNYLKDENGNDLIFTDPKDLKAYLDEMGDGAELTLVAQWGKLPKTVAVVTGDAARPIILIGISIMTLIAAASLRRKIKAK